MSLRHVAFSFILAIVVGCAPQEGDNTTPAGNGDGGTNTTSAPIQADMQLASVQVPSAT